MKIPIYQIDAFTSQCFHGNPAAVCLLDDWLSDETMQAIAMENNLAETAFVVPNGDRFRIRWFTPAVEVDLCGHATLASAYVLFHLIGVKQSVLLFDSRSGELQVKRKGELLELNFPADEINDVEPPAGLLEALGIQEAQVLRGKTDYMVVVESQEKLESIDPNHMILRKLPVRGVIVTARGIDKDFVSRFFAPGSGIDEDPVTGSAHTTLTPYWSRQLGKTVMSAAQLSARGGELECELKSDRVLLRGEGMAYLQGEIVVPD